MVRLSDDQKTAIGWFILYPIGIAALGLAFFGLDWATKFDPVQAVLGILSVAFLLWLVYACVIAAIKSKGKERLGNVIALAFLVGIIGYVIWFSVSGSGSQTDQQTPEAPPTTQR